MRRNDCAVISTFIQFLSHKICFPLGRCDGRKCLEKLDASGVIWRFTEWFLMGFVLISEKHLSSYVAIRLCFVFFHESKGFSHVLTWKSTKKIWVYNLKIHTKLKNILFLSNWDVECWIYVIFGWDALMWQLLEQTSKLFNIKLYFKVTLFIVEEHEVCETNPGIDHQTLAASHNRNLNM